MMRLLVLLFAFEASAATSPFTLLLKRKYDQSWFKITQEKKNWVCETNHFPYYEAKENPLSKLDWKALESESKAFPKDCKDVVAMEFEKKRLVTCLTQKETLSLYERITSLCRSKI